MSGKRPFIGLNVVEMAGIGPDLVLLTDMDAMVPLPDHVEAGTKSANSRCGWSTGD